MMQIDVLSPQTIHWSLVAPAAVLAYIRHGLGEAIDCEITSDRHKGGSN